MKRLSVFALATFLVTTLLFLGCLQDASAATPSRLDFPARDKPISIIVGAAPGGSTRLRTSEATGRGWRGLRHPLAASR